MITLLALWTACTPDASLPPTFVGPLDDTLRIDHTQSVGTHNSYHSEPALGRPEWDYRHAPLWQQAAEQGVRQFELDVYVDEQTGAFDVLHIPLLDPVTSCPTLADCLWAQRVWSDSDPGHLPILTLLELKTEPEDDLTTRAQLDAIEQALLDVWGPERLIRPDDVRADAPTLRDAVTDVGWPLLDGMRGRAIYVLHARGRWRDVHTDGGSDPAGQVMFQDAYGDLELPYAAFHSMNDPYDGRIEDIVASGHLVRTRADADVAEPAAGQTDRRDTALASGAHFISTDFPEPHPDSGYVVQMPGGTPSRCNPVSAPSDCTAEALVATAEAASGTR